jgi:hypothetical protein
MFLFLLCFFMIWLYGRHLVKRDLSRMRKEQESGPMAHSTDQRSLRDRFGDGMYEVGVDIAPGTYRSLGRAPLETMWQRVSDFSGTEGAIIGCGVVRGPCIVTIAATDRGFESVSSGGWKRIS